MLRPALIVAAVAAVGLGGCAKRFEGAYGTSGHDRLARFVVADGWRAAPAGVVTADDEVRELPGCG